MAKTKKPAKRKKAPAHQEQISRENYHEVSQKGPTEPLIQTTTAQVRRSTRISLMVQKKLQQSSAVVIAKSSNVRLSKSISNNLKEPTKKTLSSPKLRIKTELKKSQDKPKLDTPTRLLKNNGKTSSTTSSGSGETQFPNVPSKQRKRNSSKHQNELAYSTVNSIGDSKQLKHRSQKCPSDANGGKLNKGAENAKCITKTSGRRVTKKLSSSMSISRTPKILNLDINCENVLSSNGTLSIRQMEFSKTSGGTFPTTKSTLNLNGDNIPIFKRPSSMLVQNCGVRMTRLPSTSINKIKPVIRQRTSTVFEDSSDVSLSKKSLHVSEVPTTLPCRENEFKDAYKFIEGKILDESGGCMYVSGVPGTGKTATITMVIRTLQLQAKRNKIPQFDFIEINGMQLTEPRQAYVQIYEQLTGTKLTWEQAHSMLDKLFSTTNSNRKIIVLQMDELDALYNRRQDVIYNLLDWSTRKVAKLVVVTIANTMNLPERIVVGGVTSRLGLSRLTFQPYTQTQLQIIVQARLAGINIFEDDAIELVARKVASISGDCRRALDICRRATEIGEKDCVGKEIVVTMRHVSKAFDEMISNPKVIGIKGCSKYEKLFLQSVVAEIARTGTDETVLFKVYRQFETICTLNGVSVPEPGIALRISSRLGSSRLLICEHSNNSIHQKIMLNVTEDEMRYALEQ